MKMQTFALQPTHHFALNIAGHPPSTRFPFDGVRVQTDFPKARVSKEYCAELIAHVKRVEAEFSKPKKKYVFVEAARGKRRR